MDQLKITSLRTIVTMIPLLLLCCRSHAFRNQNQQASQAFKPAPNMNTKSSNGCKQKYSRVTTSETPSRLTMRMTPPDYPRIPTTTSHVFNYINIPYQMGIRHIHALEHISDIHLLSLPFFRLKHAYSPVSTGSYTAINCDCEVLGTPQTLRMFTNKPNESQIMCFDKDPQLHIHLTVSPLVHHPKGHTLTMVCTYYKSPRWMLTQLKPLLNFLHFMEDTIFWSYSFREQDPNLAQYRRKVLYTFKN
jgi:hypothetical protein